MTTTGENGQAHWNDVYVSKGDAGVSWFEPIPTTSLDLIRRLAVPASASVVDIGGGASHLVDSLLEDGFAAVTVLDLSAAALEASRRRLGANAEKVEWVVADVTQWGADAAFRPLARSCRLSFSDRIREAGRLCRTPSYGAEARRPRNHRHLCPGWTGTMQRSAGGALRTGGACRYYRGAVPSYR